MSAEESGRQNIRRFDQWKKEENGRKRMKEDVIKYGKNVLYPAVMGVLAAAFIWRKKKDREKDGSLTRSEERRVGKECRL